MQGNTKTLAYSLIAILALIWGSSFILIKWGLVVYSPVQVGCLRILVALLCLLPFILQSFAQVDRSKWKYLLASGMLGNGIPAMLFPLAQTRISSTLAGMINSMTPLFTLIVGVSFFGMIATRQKITGLVFGLLGAVLLISQREIAGGTTGADSFYAWFVVIATICYALSVNILRYKLSEMGSVKITGFALLFAGVPMGVYLFTTDFLERSKEIQGAGFSLFCIVLLGMLSTALSTVLFNKLIKIAGALPASSVTYLIPIVATIWGVWDHERVGWLHLIGLSAILLGVYLINRRKVQVE